MHIQVKLSKTYGRSESWKLLKLILKILKVHTMRQQVQWAIGLEQIPHPSLQLQMIKTLWWGLNIKIPQQKCYGNWSRIFLQNSTGYSLYQYTVPIRIHTHIYINMHTHMHIYIINANTSTHSGVWLLLLLLLQPIIHMALQPESQSCKLRNCTNTGQKDCVCPQRPAISIQDNRYTCKWKGKGNSEMKDAHMKGLVLHGRSGKGIANNEDESILCSANPVCTHIVHRWI